MDFNKRIELLIQSAEIAQKRGILSLDDAVIVKTAIDCIHKNQNLKVSVNILVKIAQLVQSKGGFTLEDAFYMYLAIKDIEQEIEKEPVSGDNTEKGEE